jgi:uncharacterized protein
MRLCVFSEKLDFGSPVEQVFKSLTDTDFLQTLFPRNIDFKVSKRSGRYLGTGCSLSFQARFLGIRFRWVSYVNSFSQNRHYSYVWQRSPLDCWEHDFYFETLPSGTRLTECILYRLPCGMAGKCFNDLFFGRYLRRIYRRRNERLYSELAPYNAPSGEKPLPVRAPSGVRQRTW